MGAVVVAGTARGSSSGSGGVILVLLASKPIRPPKARASRITTVNSVRSVTLTLTNTNALPGAQRGIGK